MRKQKKICFRFTTNRILGASLVVISAVNVSIVGVVFGLSISDVTPTMTVQQNPSATSTPVFTSTASEVPTALPADISTETATITETPSITPTNTSTDTLTATWTASAVPCVPRYSWMIYYVQSGDTPFALARNTGITVGELEQANCLVRPYIIRVGQILYLPRLPVTPTSIVTIMPTVTPSITVTLPPPTDFRNPVMCLYFDQYQILYFYFSVIANNPQGVDFVTSYYRIIGGSQMVTGLTNYRNAYTALVPLPTDYVTTDAISYYFEAVDNSGYRTRSTEYSGFLPYCNGGLG